MKTILFTRDREKETTTSQRYSDLKRDEEPSQRWWLSPRVCLRQLSCHSALPAGEDGELRENRVRSMATQLLAKFEEHSSTVPKGNKVRGLKRREKGLVLRSATAPGSRRDLLF